LRHTLSLQNFFKNPPSKIPPESGSGFRNLDPDPEKDHYQNLTGRSSGQTSPLPKTSSKSVHKLLRYTAKCPFTPYPLIANYPGK